jgi:hypothetical protein
MLCTQINMIKTLDFILFPGGSALILPVATVGAVGYCYMWWKVSPNSSMTISVILQYLYFLNLYASIRYMYLLLLLCFSKNWK